MSQAHQVVAHTCFNFCSKIIAHCKNQKAREYELRMQKLEISTDEEDEDNGNQKCLNQQQSSNSRSCIQQQHGVPRQRRPIGNSASQQKLELDNNRLVNNKSDNSTYKKTIARACRPATLQYGSASSSSASATTSRTNANSCTKAATTTTAKTHATVQSAKSTATSSTNNKARTGQGIVWVQSLTLLFFILHFQLHLFLLLLPYFIGCNVLWCITYCVTMYIISCFLLGAFPCPITYFSMLLSQREYNCKNF